MRSTLSWLKREHRKLKERLAKARDKAVRKHLRKEIAVIAQKILEYPPEE